MNSGDYKLSMRIAFALLAMAITTTAAVHADNKYWEARVSLFEKIPVERGDIVFLGNSITDGGEFNELFEMENIKNRGISGDVISGVRRRLAQVTKGQPAKIFLLIGINDVSHKKGAKKIAAEYEQLVREIREQAPETRLYIQSVMPINNSFGRYKNLQGQEAVVPELNALLREIAERYGVEYIDLWPALADKQGRLKKEYTNDGLHLLGAAYKSWAQLLRPYVTEP